MAFATYLQIKTKVEKDLDLEDEDFIQDDEMLGYCNEAIHEAESIILRLCEDYFLDQIPLALVSGTKTYALPDDIYGDKIRKLVYSNGQDIFVVKRLRYTNQFEDLAWMDAQGSIANPAYQYLITNDVTDGRLIAFYPTPQVSGAYCTLWYIRKARVVALDADVVDIPEFRSFIEQFIKVRCYEKEMNPKLTFAIKALETERQVMIESLRNRFPDDETEVPADMSFYQEHL